MLLKDSGIEWIGTQPSKWQVDRIKDVIPKVFGGGTPDSSEPEYWEDGSIVWITPTDFQDYENELLITNSRRKITEKGLKSCSAILLPAGTVIMASRATIGDVKIAGTELCTNQGFISFVCDKLSNKFFYYLIKAYLGDLFVNIAPGTTFKEIGRSAVKKEYIVFPGIDEQRRIAAYLDKTCAAIDVAIEKKKKQLETLDALRKSIIHKAVTRGLDDSVELKESGVEWIGKIPKHWQHNHLKRVCVKIQTGTTPPTANTEYYVDGTIPWYAPGCYDGSLYLEEPSKLINELAYHDNKLRLFPAESIFLVGIGATIGKVAMTKTEASCNQQITAIVCNAEVSSKYMTYQMKIYEGIIPKISQYTTLPIMDQVKIGYLRVVIPATIEEQELIADYLDDEMSEISKLENNLRSQIDTLEQYRKSLIHECVTGKRRITEEDIQQY